MLRVMLVDDEIWMLRDLEVLLADLWMNVWQRAERRLLFFGSSRNWGECKSRATTDYMASP